MGKHVHAEPAPFPLGALLDREITRSEAEALIAALIDGLDGLDPDPDLEADVDADPVADDLKGELDAANDEPSLGAPERHPDLWDSSDQTTWACGSLNDCELVNEDGGDIQSEPHDDIDGDREPDVDGEPALGWTNHINQEKAGRISVYGFHDENEPNLGAPENPHKQRSWAQGAADEREVDDDFEEDRSDQLDRIDDRDLKDNAALMASLPPISLETLAAAPDLYAIQGIGDCMLPLIGSGAKMVMDKREECRPGDLVCIFHSAPQGVVAKLKRLVAGIRPGMTFPARFGNGELTILVAVEMLNPPTMLYYPADEIYAVHKCIGLKRADGWYDDDVVRRNAEMLAEGGQGA